VAAPKKIGELSRAGKRFSTAGGGDTVTVLELRLHGGRGIP
jgi:hypothetical protein